MLCWPGCYQRIVRKENAGNINFGFIFFQFLLKIWSKTGDLVCIFVCFTNYRLALRIDNHTFILDTNLPDVSFYGIFYLFISFYHTLVIVYTK